MLSDSAFDAALSATAEGYSFPTNLDRDPPVNGLAPVTQKDILRAAVADGLTENALAKALDDLNERQKA